MFTYTNHRTLKRRKKLTQCPKNDEEPFVAKFLNFLFFLKKTFEARSVAAPHKCLLTPITEP
jgi:hypothetical protein